MLKKILTRQNVLYQLVLVLIAVSLAACSKGSLPQSPISQTPVASTPNTPPTATASTTVTADSTGTSNTSGFTLTSPDVVQGGTLPAEYTCDGASSTLALTWSGAPEETAGYTVIMHHVASPEDIHWYWVLYDIPAEVTSLPKNVTEIGTLGNNSVNGRTEFAPPCSKGPGPKVYTYTIYALSAQPQFSGYSDQVSRATLLAAIQNITLTSAKLDVTYTRP